MFSPGTEDSVSPGEAYAVFGPRQAPGLESRLTPGSPQNTPSVSLATQNTSLRTDTPTGTRQTPATPSTGLLSCTTLQTYLATLKPKATEDPMSLCSLLTRKVTQSTNIRLGNELEVLFNLYVTSKCIHAVDLRPAKVKKGEHQKDFLRALPDNVLVYGEFKSNINLDTEKRKATRDKVNAVAAELTALHPDKVIKPYLVALRYLRTSDIPPLVAASYSDVTLIGVGDFFRTVLQHPLPDFDSYPAYTAFLMSVVDRLEPVA